MSEGLDGLKHPNGKRGRLITCHAGSGAFFLSFFLNRPLLPCGVKGFLLVNLLDNW
jgi:hypothetical protein